MKSKIISVLLVFMLVFSITACSRNESNTNTDKESNEISDTNVSNATTSDNKPEGNENSLVLDSYKAVLENKENFLSTDNNKSVSLNSFLANNGIYGATFKLTHFTVLDMNGDKIPEVVLELTVGDNVEFYEVLHNMNGKVNGYLRVLRGLESLKEDGTYGYSNSSSNWGFAKLKFEANGTVTDDKLGYCEPSQNNDSTAESYFVQNKSTTKDLFDSYADEQNRKKDVVWYDFSQDNIAKLLPTK
jgi:hypothetical protein